MKTFFTILQMIAVAIVTLVMACVYMFIFTPLYMITMAVIGMSFDDICDKWVRISGTLIETFYEEA